MSVVAAFGVALLVWSVGLSLFYARLLRRRGESARPAVRAFVRRPNLWLGVALVLAPISPAASGALIVAALVFALVLVVIRARARAKRT